MKKLFNVEKLHENKNYEDQLMTHNINELAFEKELLMQASICRNVDIEEKYINRVAIYKGIYYVVKIRVYIDTRTNTLYSYKLHLNEEFSYYVDLLDSKKDIIELRTLKPLNHNNIYYEEDYDKLIEALV